MMLLALYAARTGRETSSNVKRSLGGVMGNMYLYESLVNIRNDSEFANSYLSVTLENSAAL